MNRQHEIDRCEANIIFLEDEVEERKKELAASKNQLQYWKRKLSELRYGIYPQTEMGKFLKEGGA